MTLVSVSDVTAQMGRALTEAETARVQSDLDAIQATIEQWANVKLESVPIVDEYHRLLYDTDRIVPNYPALSIQGIKLYDKSATLDTTYNTYLDDAYFGVPTVVYLSYTTDDGPIQPFLPIVKNLMIHAVINGLLKPDVVKFGVISGYSVEGTTINYSSGTPTPSGTFGSIPVADLAPLQRMRRLVIG